MKKVIGIILVMAAVSAARAEVDTNTASWAMQQYADWLGEEIAERRSKTNAIVYTGSLTNVAEDAFGIGDVSTREHTPWDNSASDWIDKLDSYDATTNAIKLLVKSGRVCEVIGHKWSDGITEQLAFGWDFQYSVPLLDLPKETRTCLVCGKTQTKTERWEDDI